MRVTVVVVIALLSVLQAVADDSSGANEGSLRFTYVVKAAPVWTADGTFDPSVLIKFIETSTGHQPLHVHRFPKTGALSITAPVDVHEKIWVLLKQIPSLAAAWGPGDPDYPRLLRDQTRWMERNQELRRLSERMERSRLDELRRRNSFDAVLAPSIDLP